MDICAVGVPTFHTRVEAWECDHNQHWNVRQYMRCFQQAGFVAASMGPSGPVHPWCQHTRYHRELLQTSPVEIRTSVIADGPLEGALVHVMNSNGRLSATALDHSGIPGSGLPRVQSADVALALPRGIDSGPHGGGMAPASPAGRVAEHGMVQPREVDHTGSLTFDCLMGRIAAASNDFLARLGFTVDYARDHALSRMGVETKVTLLAPIPAGTRTRGTVRAVHAGRKNLVLRHSIFTIDGDEVAAADQSLVTVDMTTRRATELPAFLKDAVGAF